jgi:hypothetical protein
MRRSRIVISLAVVGLLSTIVVARKYFAQDAPGKGKSDLSLTIYNQNFGVVRQPIALDLQPGTNNIRYTETTAHLEPDSVILRDPSGAHRLEILEQNYRNDPLSEALLLSMNEGKVLDFEVQRDGKTEIVKGKVVRSGYVPHYEAFQRYGAQYQAAQMAYANPSSGSGEPIIEIDGKIHFGLPGKPIFPQLSDTDIVKPTLDWLLRTDAAGKVNAEISYVTGGMNWQADYNVVAPPKGDVLDVIGWVTMDNQSGKTFEHAQIKLMAGDVNKIQPGVLAGAMVSMGASNDYRMAGGPQVTQKGFDEYHLYTLHRLVTLHDRETKQVEFVRAGGVRSQRVLVYDGAHVDPNRYGYYNYEQIRGDRSYGTESNPKVWVMQEIKNSKANGLGIPLPKGRVRFYRRDDDESLQFTGENLIDHTPEDETLRIFTGNSFDVVGERRQTNYVLDTNKHFVDESFEIKVRNHKKEPVDVRVVEHMYRWLTWDLTAKSDDFTKTDAHTGEFPVHIPPAGEKTITYTVHYSW